jgi:hypothetical protein
MVGSVALVEWAAVIGLWTSWRSTGSRMRSRAACAGRALFTEGERSYAATQGRPARHLAARFCAKEAVSKALEMDVLHPRDIEVVGGGDGPPRVTLHGPWPRARRRSRRGPHLPDAHEVDRGRGGGAAIDRPGGWLQGLPDPERMRATDRWGHRGAGHPRFGADGAGGARPGRTWSPRGSRRDDRHRLRQGQQRRRWVRRRETPARERARGAALAVAPVSELTGDARASAERVEDVEPFDAARLAGCAAAVDALLGTGFSGTPHGAVAGAIEALNDAGLPIVAADVPSGRRRRQRRGGGRGDPRRATATFAAAKPGL